MKKITKIESIANWQINKKLRVAAYCRVSTDSEDQLVSLETQKAHYKEYITSNPEWEFAGIYYDEGISGTKKDKRPALMQMMSDCDEGKIDFIVTKSLSRFARNTTDCLELVRRLLNIGIPIYFEKENLNTGTMETELFLSVMSNMAENESISISENTKWSIRNSFINGKYKFRYAPYGYSLSDGTLIINEDEAKWVRFIFNEALLGKGATKIATTLNELNVPARKKGVWYSSSILGILHNEKYIGACLYQKTYTDSKFNRHINNGTVDQYYEEDHHEAIVSKEIFEAAGGVISQNSRVKQIFDSGKTCNNRYCFSQKIVCGECGSLFKRRINTPGNKKYVAWVCKTHVENKNICSMKYVRETSLKDAFTTMMNKLIFGRKEILQTLLNSIITPNHKIIFSQMSELDQQVGQILQRRQNLKLIMTRGYIEPSAYAQENNSLLIDQETLMVKKQQLRDQINGGLSKTDALRDILKFTNKSPMLEVFNAELFEKFVDYVVVHSQSEFEFQLKCGLNLKEKIA